MTSSLLTLAFLLATAQAAQLAAEELQTTVLKGRYFKVETNCSDENVQQQALLTADAVWPFARKLFGNPEVAPDQRLTVHLHRSIEEYEAAEQKLTRGRFRENLAFSSWVTREAHVAIQPPCSDQALEQIGLPALTRRQVAHEAAHVVCYYALDCYKELPGWLAEGTACLVEQQVMETLDQAPVKRGDPFYSKSVLRVQGLLDSDQLPTAEQILRDDFGELSRSERYSVQTQWLEFLIEDQRKSLTRLLRELKDLRSSADTSNQIQRLVDKLFGSKSRLKSLDKKFREYLRTHEADWDEVYRSLDVRTDGWYQGAFPGSNAIAWQQTPVGRQTYRIRGSLEILPSSGHRQLNLLLGRNSTGFVSVAFSEGFGINLFHYTSADRNWETLGKQQTDLLDPSRTSFSVLVTQDAIEVELGGEPVLSVDRPLEDLAGPYGVGAQKGTTGIWRDVALLDE
jgi:hypothetical protein